MTGRSILIVEDEPRIAHWLKVRFEGAGFSAEVAHDGRTGLARARARRPDLIVLDLMLPRLDGMQVCRILRRESAVPIIMLTARETHADRIAGLDSGADDYVVKPFDPDEVVARAKAVLRRVADTVQQVLTCGAITIDETTRQVTVGDRPLELSSAQFARAMLATTALGGLLIAAVAVALAAWIARRITAPVTLLTRAARKIARGGDSALLPVTSADELGQMSAAFNRMTQALHTQRALRRRLINDLSHELNTPLSVIQLEAQGLRDGLQEPDEAADRIIGEVTLLANLVRDLNWLAETDSGDLRLSREPCQLGDLLDVELHRWQPQARRRRISLECQPRSGLPALALDRMRMSQALGNVVQNALQHTDAGGRITLAAAPAPDGAVAITVADDGAGIAADELPHLFERLYRADASRTRGTGGSGLGLAIARAIVTAHAGTITVTSAGLDQGTTVCICLPGAT